MKIEFLLEGPYVHDEDIQPIPAKNDIPKWFKDMPGIAIGQEDPHESSIKRCMPFLDVLTAGYFYRSPCDINLKGWPDKSTETGKQWSAKWAQTEYPKPWVSEHGVGQVGTHPWMKKEKALPLKFNFCARIRTPPGYSTLITAPINDYTLPEKGIHILAGILDSDMYHEVNFPFFFTNFSEREVHIPKGTSIVQMIPFKRDEWVHEKEEVNTNEDKALHMKLRSTFINNYKKMFWKKKSFK